MMTLAYLVKVLAAVVSTVLALQSQVGQLERKVSSLQGDVVTLRAQVNALEQAQAKTVTVTGAEWPAVDGTFEQIGVLRGLPLFKRIGQVDGREWYLGVCTDLNESYFITWNLADPLQDTGAGGWHAFMPGATGDYSPICGARGIVTIE
jgi:hypothetical protein